MEPMTIWSTEGGASVAPKDVSIDASHSTPFEHRFNPYDFNGG